MNNVNIQSQAKKGLRPPTGHRNEPQDHLKGEGAGRSRAEEGGSRHDDELSIVIWPDQFVEYRGSRPTLEAEGFIPNDLKWPEGKNDVRWSDDRHKYWMMRCRPEGMKGQMRMWVEGDYWSIRISQPETPTYAAIDIKQKARALREAVHQHSDAGRREFQSRWNAYWKAHEDSAFQAFKARVVPPAKKRGRPAKSQ